MFSGKSFSDTLLELCHLSINTYCSQEVSGFIYKYIYTLYILPVMCPYFLIILLVGYQPLWTYSPQSKVHRV